MKKKKTQQLNDVYDFIANYEGNNPHLLYLSRRYNANPFVFSDFDIEYINNNWDYQSQEVNRIVNITRELGEKIYDKEGINFIPQKLWIGKIVGEMGNSYHCYVKYRQLMDEKLMYISKRGILNDITPADPDEIDVDFDTYDSRSARKLKNHQKQGVKFLLASKRCILADSMGTGKTTQLVVATLETGVKKVLVVCPASLKTNWKREILVYDDEENITIINSNKWPEKRTRWTIINYDILQNFYNVPTEEVYRNVRMANADGSYDVYKIKDTKIVNGVEKVKTKKSIRKAIIQEAMENSPLFQEEFDCVIIDEAHKLSNKTSIRYKVLEDFLHRKKPEYIFLTTGTPLTNKPINLYWILKLIDADITKDYRYYVERFCDARTFRRKSDGKEITITSGASNLEELRERIKHLYIRREMKDVTDMVQKNIVTLAYDLSEAQQREYDKLWDEYQEAQTLRNQPDNEEYRQLVEGIIVRQYLAIEMIPHTINLLNDLMEETGKVVVICTFQEEMNKFKEHYGKEAVLFNGSMTNKQKDASVDAFMNDDKVKVFIGQVEAMVGITLTSANNMVFNSFSWISASNAQAEDRIYRLTQDKDVNCIYQIFNDNISLHMLNVVTQKTLMADEVIKTEKVK